MPYKLYPIEKFSVEPGYNDLVRSPKDVTANAVELAEFMEAEGDVPELHPIKFVKGPNGELFTRNHATLKAAEMRKWPNLLAIESPHAHGSVADMLDLLFSNNQGHPIGRVAQGKLYKSLSDGIPAEDSTEEVPKWTREPMTPKEIAAACKPVYTEQHIKDCITLCESSPEIQELMEGDLVSANIVITARQWAKGDEAKQLRILKAAVKEADGVKATKKHIDAIKSQFVELKAAPVDGGDNGKPAKSKGNKGAPATDLSLPPVDDDQEKESQQNLFEQTPDDPVVLKSGSKENKKLKGALITRLLDTEYWEKKGVSIVLTEDEAEITADDLIALFQTAHEVF